LGLGEIESVLQGTSAKLLVDKAIVRYYLSEQPHLQQQQEGTLVAYLKLPQSLLDEVIVVTSRNAYNWNFTIGTYRHARFRGKFHVFWGVAVSRMSLFTVYVNLNYLRI
jgi:hypothetical protein